MASDSRPIPGSRHLCPGGAVLSWVPSLNRVVLHLVLVDTSSTPGGRDLGQVQGPLDLQVPRYHPAAQQTQPETRAALEDKSIHQVGKQVYPPPLCGFHKQTTQLKVLRCSTGKTPVSVDFTKVIKVI